ncbi:nucleotidyltransferase domain-containing protein [Kibdelosporangium phytohabitans]|uniref:nucleotidyltransferase domain-containing protein n=1 Tax=Kibdelosporangium phytohabitans TaxID=860235 RepID=UPI0019E81916|nr:hypothetical protein [Kibdelosporangium phytohabitans]MBE1462544.1 hypothetical protein [Kibdelosporangium phytohabitans]
MSRAECGCAESGKQTRDHRDLDLMHRFDEEDLVLVALARAEFAETLDARPVRFVHAHPDGRESTCTRCRYGRTGVPPRRSST